MEHESDGDTNCIRYSHLSIGTETGGLGNKRNSGDHPNNSIVEISQNTKKSPKDLRRLTVTQTPVKNHLLALVWKTLKRENNNHNNDTQKNCKYMICANRGETVNQINEYTKLTQKEFKTRDSLVG